jgi:hypothetical protein
MMGRSFQSVRMGVQRVTDRWERAACAMRDDDAACAGQLVTMAKMYSSEAFYAFDDPLEAAIFSIFIRMCRELVQDNGQEIYGVQEKTGHGHYPFKQSPCRPVCRDEKEEQE